MASSPKAPDPYKQMQASNNANMWSAFTNSVMGNANTVGPYGSTTSKVTGYIPYKDPTTGQTYQIPQFTQTTTPSADQARLLGQETNLKSGMMSSAANQLGTYSKLGAVDPSKFHAWGAYEKGPELVTPDEAYRKEIQDKMMASYTRGVAPQQQAEDAQLAARGQSPGGQMDYTMRQGRNDAAAEAARQAFLAAGEEGRSEATGINQTRQQGWQNANLRVDQGNQLRKDQWAEAEGQRTNLINRIMAQLTGGQATMPASQSWQGGQVNPFDIAGAQNNKYNIDMQNAANRNKALFGIGSSILSMFNPFAMA
jgi:hypothetical protein